MVLVASHGWKSLCQQAFAIRNARCSSFFPARSMLRNHSSSTQILTINRRASSSGNGLHLEPQCASPRLSRLSTKKQEKRWNACGQQWRVFGTNSSSSSPSHDDQPTESGSKSKAKSSMKVVVKKMIQDENIPSPKMLVEQAWNVPNMITIARIVATPYISYLIVDGSYQNAIGLLGVAAVSDWMDGYIARRLNQQTVLGSFLDPFADKMMVGCLSLSLMWQQLLPWELVALIVGRDAFLIAGTVYHRYKTKANGTDFFDTTEATSFKVQPSMLSKVNTALQFSTFGLALVNAAWQIPGDVCMNLLFGLVGTTTVMSGGGYYWDYMHRTGAFHQLKKRLPRMRK